VLRWTNAARGAQDQPGFGAGAAIPAPATARYGAYLARIGEDTILCVAICRGAAQQVDQSVGIQGRVTVEMLADTTSPPIGELPYL